MLDLKYDLVADPQAVAYLWAECVQLLGAQIPGKAARNSAQPEAAIEPFHLLPGQEADLPTPKLRWSGVAVPHQSPSGMEFASPHVCLGIDPPPAAAQRYNLRIGHFYFFAPTSKPANRDDIHSRPSTGVHRSAPPVRSRYAPQGDEFARSAR